MKIPINFNDLFNLNNNILTIKKNVFNHLQLNFFLFEKLLR